MIVLFHVLSCFLCMSGFCQVYAVSYLVEVALLQLLVIGPMSGSLHCVVYWEVCAALGWLVYWLDLSCGLVQGVSLWQGFRASLWFVWVFLRFVRLFGFRGVPLGLQFVVNM